MNRNIFFSKACLFLVLTTAACSKKANIPNATPVSPDSSNVISSNVPPATWQEHWFEHRQLLKRVFYDTSVAVYYDDEVQRSITWPYTYLAQVWNYTKKTYDAFGQDSRLFVVLHAGKYSGGHPSTYMDSSHNYRNTIDCGSDDPNAWTSGTGNDIDLVTHEVGHIVEGASKGVHNSPAFNIWHDSKWMEIYQYDVYLGLGRNDDALRWYNLKLTQSDDFPRAGTHWFRDWFYPLYMNYGKTAVLNNFFTLLGKYFPKLPFNNGVSIYPQYTRDMNFGEFVHFWSGAAGKDVKQLALVAFGPKDEQGNDWTVQLQQAKNDFPGISYSPDTSATTTKDITAQAMLTVSKENDGGVSADEGSSKLVDNNINTKFFVSGLPADFFVQLAFTSPQIIVEYTLTSGNDAPDRDPKDWKLLGSNDGTAWTEVDTRSDEMFDSRTLTKNYTFNNMLPFAYYRLSVIATNGSTDFQLSEFRLIKQ